MCTVFSPDTVTRVITQTRQRHQTQKFMQDWACPTEFYGCGSFVAASWRIFCRGDLSPENVQCPTLKRYLRWEKSGAAAACDPDLSTTPLVHPGKKRSRLHEDHLPPPTKSDTVTKRKCTQRASRSSLTAQAEGMDSKPDASLLSNAREAVPVIGLSTRKQRK